MAARHRHEEDSADELMPTSTTSTAASVTSQKGDWTIVQKEDRSPSLGRSREEEMMIVGDMEGLDLNGSAQSIDDRIIAENRFKSKERNAAIDKIRKDVDAIVAGICLSISCS